MLQLPVLSPFLTPSIKINLFTSSEKCVIIISKKRGAGTLLAALAENDFVTHNLIRIMPTEGNI